MVGFFSKKDFHGGQTFLVKNLVEDILNGRTNDQIMLGTRWLEEFHK